MNSILSGLCDAERRKHHNYIIISNAAATAAVALHGASYTVICTTEGLCDLKSDESAPEKGFGGNSKNVSWEPLVIPATSIAVL